MFRKNQRHLQPRLISDLNDKGLWVEQAKKGAGSIKYGLGTLRGFDKIVIDSSLDNRDERNIYKD